MTDQELIGYLDKRFGEIVQKVDEKFESFREENRQARAALEEEVRQTRGAMDLMHCEIEVIADGVMGLREPRLEARQFEILFKLDELKTSIDPLYQDLNRRVKSLEGKTEQQAHRILEVIRERLGGASSRQR